MRIRCLNFLCSDWCNARKDQHAELDRSEPGRLFRVSWEALEGEDFSTAFLRNCSGYDRQIILMNVMSERRTKSLRDDDLVKIWGNAPRKRRSAAQRVRGVKV